MFRKLTFHDAYNILYLARANLHPSLDAILLIFVLFRKYENIREI